MGLPNTPKPRIPIKMNSISHPPKGAHDDPDGLHGFIPQTPKTRVITKISQNQMFAPMVYSFFKSVMRRPKFN